MDRVVTKFRLGDQVDEIEYWRGVAPEDRVAAVEVLRKRVFGGTDAAGRGLQRVCRITRRA
jgi:hypothetical protein